MTRNLVFLGCLWVTAATLALAQDAPPAPPAPAAVPAPATAPMPPYPAAPAPAAAPAAPSAPVAPPKAAKAPKAIVIDGDQVMNLEDWAQYADSAAWKAYQDDMKAYEQDMKAYGEEMKAYAKEQSKAAAKAGVNVNVDAGELGQELRDAIANQKWDSIGELTGEITSKALAAQSKAFKFQQDSGTLFAQVPPQQPTAPGQLFTPPGQRGPQAFGVGQARALAGRMNSDDRTFDRGENNLDTHNLDNALVNFNEVISRGGTKADGALYYKAFTLNRMGRRDEAQAAINELRKSYPNSKWLEDAKALETDVKSGKSTSDDDDLKLLAIDGLMQTDPERAFPVLEGLIRGAHVPSLKKQAVFVLAKNTSPRAQTLLEQIARGTVGDPDQQLMALRYVVDVKSNPARAQLLMDVYNGAGNDPAVRSVVIRSFVNSRDFDHLAQIAKVEKNNGLREEAISKLGDEDGQPQLWQIYAAETTPEGKRNILDVMRQNGNMDKLAEVARTDKDPSVRKEAIMVLATQKGTNVSPTLAAIYANEQDTSVKKQIISGMVRDNDAKALIDLARKEKDVEMKRYIVSRLINIHSPEVTDFLVEILKP